MDEEERAGEQVQDHVCVQIEDRIRAEPALTPAQQSHSFPLESPATSGVPAAVRILPFCLQSALPEAAVALPECRICQEEADPSQMETPCDCSGTLKYAHRECIQRWCNEKGDTICEICHKPYKQGYSVSELQYQGGSAAALDLSDTWEMELRDPRILALAATQRRLLESDYEDYSAVSSGSAACVRSVVLILMALLLLRQATPMASASEDEDALLFLMIFLLRMIGFLLPCYIMVRAMNMLQQGQQEQAEAATAAEISLLLQNRHPPRSFRIALVPTGDLP